MIKDVGNLSKILMAYNGYRDTEHNVKDALSHELSDILWSLIVIAEETGVDIEKAYFNTLEDLNKRIDKNVK